MRRWWTVQVFDYLGWCSSVQPRLQGRFATIDAALCALLRYGVRDCGYRLVSPDGIGTERLIR